MICKYCRLEKTLIKAHIIPKAFFIPLRKENEPARLMSQNGYPKKSPIGVYDKEILCAGCEKGFQSWDDYGQKIFLQEFDQFSPRIYHGNVVGYERSEIDYSRLKLFFLSVLWRASVSNHDFYASINLGSSERSIQDQLERNDPGNADEFSIVLAHFDDPLSKKTMINPRLTSFDGINYYVFDFTVFVAYIKDGNIPISTELRNFQLAPGQDLAILSKDFQDSYEMEILDDIVKKTRDLMQR